MLTPKKSITRPNSILVWLKLLLAWLQSCQPQQLFLLIGIPIGLLFVFMVPPYQVPDEQAHFARAYQVSEGGLTSQHIPFGVGGRLPESLLATANKMTTPEIIQSHRASFSQTKAIMDVPLNRAQKAPIHFENTALYSPLAYVPAAVGIAVARLFDSSVLVLFYVGRICTLVAWLALAYWAIRTTLIGKWAFLVVALAPMAIFQGASLSADAVTLGFCLLLPAWFVRMCLTKGDITRREWILTAALVFISGLIKQPYALVGLLFLFVPGSRFGNKRMRWQYVASILAAFMVLFSCWYVVSQHSYIQSPFLIDRVITPNAQLSFVLHHPVRYAHTVFATHVLGGDNNIYEFVGVFGWLDTAMPLWAVLAYFATLAIALPMGAIRLRLGKTQRLVLLALALALFCTIDLLLYMYWNSLGGTALIGIQGRYYLMVAPLILLAVHGLYEVRGLGRFSPKVAVLCGIGLVLGGSILTLLHRFYV